MLHINVDSFESRLTFGVDVEGDSSTSLILIYCLKLHFRVDFI